MAKVFRLHQGQDGTGWFISQPLNKNDLKTIKTAGKDVATSIPSPFAQIDLVKSAFQWVVDNGIDGQTAQHKLVSDTLDIAQLFYASQKYKGKIEIVAWNPNERLTDLIADINSPRHKKFAETLKIFWEQDSVPENERGILHLYNFEHLRRFYFIINKNTGQVIGGTSPATLFFAAPDARKVTAELNIICGPVKLFNNEYSSLNKREPSFIEYIYVLSKQPGFAIYFPEVYSYCEEVRQHHLSGVLQAKVTNFNSSSMANYPCCPVFGNVNDPCEVLGIQLGIQTLNESNIEQDSDFVIQSDLPFEGQKPLILPFDRFALGWTYTTNGINWNENTQVPYRNTNNPEQSILPSQQNKYYWLSGGNFFEDKIFELPYSIDSIKFNICGGKNYLLPLTQSFFKYFSADKVSEYLKLEKLAGGGVEAKLEIPVKAGKILYKKTYHLGDIEKIEFHVSILPFLKTEKVKLDYTIGVLDARTVKTSPLNVTCFEKGNLIEIGAPIVRRPGLQGDIKTSYYKSNHLFDTIRIGCDTQFGYIIPLMKNYEGANEISFSVDFGTTNTHIEYVHTNNVAKAFDNTADNPIWGSLVGSDNEREYTQRIEIFESEIIPYLISNDSNYKFPFRTALTVNQNINFDEPVEAFRHTNDYLLFEKVHYPRYLDLRTQLKWSNYSKPEDKILVESFIDCLMLIVLYKTILLGGDPRKTKITWFYPVSMDTFELGIFFKAWENSYKRLYKTNDINNINGIPESVAPYLYYKSQYPGLSLSIDVGGGSSDIAFFEREDNKPKFISSFKFAGNAIFGDGFPSKEFKNNSDNNGFVRTFYDKAFNAIKKIPQKEQILAEIIHNRKDSSDFSSFLFSLENEKNINFNYTTLLQQDKKLKLPILIFYAAIAFYSAKLLLKNGISKLPDNILFSGTASKTALIIDPTPNYTNISNLYKYLFNSILKSKETKDLKIVISEIPKEITCKGILKSGLIQNSVISPIVFWIGGNSSDIWGKAIDKKLDFNITPKYGEINDQVEVILENSIFGFYNLLDLYFTNINIEEFGIDTEAYEKFKNLRTENIKDYLRQGLKAFYKKEDKQIEETLFFYPLIGILNKLAYELSLN
jgi:hypothetical protein